MQIYFIKRLYVLFIFGFLPNRDIVNMHYEEFNPFIWK